MSRVALVTGGTRGIGLATARHLAAQGYAVVATARGSPSAALGEGMHFHACDVADPASVRALLASVGDRFGRLDVLVNNAGLAGTNDLTAREEDDALWHAILASNLHGTYYACKAALPLLPDRTGRIINVSSVLGLKGVPDQPAYCAAKHGVNGLTRSLALALAPRGITVNAVCPGWVETDMAAARYVALGMTAEDAAKGTPTGRVTRPEEVAAMIGYLASEAAGNVTGQTFVIDGGALA